MRPRPRKAPSLSTVRRAAVVATLAALAVIFVSAGAAKPPPVPVGNYQVCLAASADSCTPTAAGGDYSVLAGGNPQVNVTITNDGSSNQTLDYADVTVPGSIGLSIDTTHSPQSASYTAYAGTSTPTILQLRNLALLPGRSQTVSFYVNSTASSCTDGNWSTVAKTGSQPSAFVFANPPVKASGLTSLVAQSCTLDFTVQPTAALKNTVITGQAYTPGAANVTIAPHDTLPVTLNTGTASLTVAGDSDPGNNNLAVFTGTGSTAFSGGSVVFSALQSSGTGGPFTLTAHANGFADAGSSAFVVTQDGEPCAGNPCATLNGKAGNNPLVSIVASGGFSFVGASPSGVPLDPDHVIPTDPPKLGYPLGCQSWTPTTGASGFVEFDGRTTGGSLQISYFVSQTVLKARYGKNTGNQFVPICFGVKYLDDQQQPKDCRTDAQDPGTSWMGDELDPVTGAFTGGTARSICGAGGYYWGILSSYQDKLTDPFPRPVVTGFNGPTNPGQNFRTFVISIPPGIDARGGC